MPLPLLVAQHGSIGSPRLGGPQHATPDNGDDDDHEVDGWISVGHMHGAGNHVNTFSLKGCGLAALF